MQDQKQDVVVGAEPQKARPEQRRTVHVEGCQGFSLGFQLCLFEQECLGADVSGGRLPCDILDNER